MPVDETVPLEGRHQPLGVLQALLGRKLGSPVAFFERPGVETVIAFEPFEVIRARGPRAEIEHRGQRFTLEKKPLAAIAERLAHHPALRRGGFRGGALGYVSYDTVRLLEPTLTHVPGNLERLEASPGLDAEVALFRKAIVFDHQRGHAVLVSGSFPGEPPADLSELRRLLDAPAFSLFALTQAPMEMDKMCRMLGRERFLRGVAQLKEHIYSGDIFQAVLSDELSCPFQGDALQLFGHLCALSPSGYRFILVGTERTVMGASPEMLLRVQGSALETHPIAGTYRCGDDAAEEAALEARLLADEKERAEHLMLVDLARNDLGRVAKAGTVAVHDFMHVRRFGAVMHLVSRVTAERLPHVSALQALASCFPAGTAFPHGGE
jgi:anthranilate synthase component 1